MWELVCLSEEGKGLWFKGVWQSLAFLMGWILVFHSCCFTVRICATTSLYATGQGHT